MNVLKLHFCSFCGAYKIQVDYIIAGPHNTNICNKCVAICQDIINKEEEKKKLKGGVK